MRTYILASLFIVFNFVATNGQSMPFVSTSKEKSVAATSPSEDEDYARIETRLVVSAVQILDKKGSKVTGLLPSDFEVREEGELQEIQSVTYGGSSGAGHSIVLVIDYSSSIVPYMETSLKSAETLVNLLGPNDQLAIVTDDIEILADFSSDKALLMEKIESIRQRYQSGVTGKSRQFCALMRTLRELAPRATHPPVVIFQTDGDQYAMLKRPPGSAPPGKSEIRYGVDDLLDLAKDTHTTIYTVSPGRFVEDLPKDVRAEIALAEDISRRAFVEATSEIRYQRKLQKLSPRFLVNWYRTRTRDQGGIVNIAVKSGGWADDLPDASEAPEIYSRILNGDGTYVISYYPKNQSFDGAKRNVAISLRNNPGYAIRGGKSYVAATSNQ